MKQPDMHSAKRFLRPITYGVIFGAAVCLALLLLASLLMSLRDIPQPAVGLISTLAFVLAGFTAGFTSAALSRERGLLTGLCCGVILFLVLVLANLAVGEAQFGGAAVSKLIAILLASALGGVVGVNQKRRFKAIKTK